MAKREFLAFLLLGLLLMCPTVRAEDGKDDHEDSNSEYNTHKEDDEEYWSKTRKIDGSRYNDDKYTCSKRVCSPPRLQDCCGTCSATSGTSGIFTIPFGGECKAGTYQTAKSNTSAWCVMANVDAKQCCAYAVSNKAYYWQHFLPPG